MKQTNFDLTEEKLNRILEYTAEHFAVDINEVLGKKRTSKIALARHCIFYALHSFTLISSTKLGKLLNRDHSTVLNSINQITNYISYENEYKKIIEEYINNVREYLEFDYEKYNYIKTLKIKLVYYKNKCKKLQKQLDEARGE